MLDIPTSSTVKDLTKHTKDGPFSAGFPDFPKKDFMTFLHQNHPAAFLFQKIVKWKKLYQNSMQDKRGSELMLRSDVFLR